MIDAGLQESIIQTVRQAVKDALALPNKPDRLLSADDLAAFLNVSRRKVDEMQNSGELPQPIRFGRRVRRWQSKQIKSWLDTFPNQGGGGDSLTLGINNDYERRKPKKPEESTPKSA